MKIWRHLVEQDQDGLTAVEEIQPILFVGSFGSACPERSELFAFAELAGDIAPKEMIRVVASVERGGSRTPKRGRVERSPAVRFAKLRMFGEKAEADEKVGLATTHSLLQVEDGLRRRPGKAGNALTDEVLHALRDLRLIEELGAIAFGGDQLVELLDLVAELD